MQTVDPQTLIPGETYYLMPTSDYLYSKYTTLAKGIFNNYRNTEWGTNAVFSNITPLYNEVLATAFNINENGEISFHIFPNGSGFNIYKTNIINSIRKPESLQSLASQKIPVDLLKGEQGSHQYNMLYLGEPNKRPDPNILNGTPSEEDNMTLEDRRSRNRGGRRRRKSRKSRKSRKTKSRRRR
jgi:hypothetical protein